jgi:hypothetical protein
MFQSDYGIQELYTVPTHCTEHLTVLSKMRNLRVLIVSFILYSGLIEFLSIL